jgi:hypothetical protein
MEPGLAAAIAAWAEGMSLAPALARPSAGCETTSGRYGAQGIFGRMNQMPRRVLTAALLVPEWLVWATRADDGEPFVTGVRLADVQIRDYRATPEYELMIDEGLLINGAPGAGPADSSLFLGLGEEPDGLSFKEKVLAAWRSARAG